MKPLFLAIAMEKRVYTPHSNMGKPWLMLREIVQDIGAQEMSIRRVHNKGRDSSGIILHSDNHMIDKFK